MTCKANSKTTYVKWKTGFGIVEFSVSKGSKISRNPVKSWDLRFVGRFRDFSDIPFSYVATSVAKLAIFCRAANSSRRVRSRVLTRDCSLSAQNLEGSTVGIELGHFQKGKKCILERPSLNERDVLQVL